MTELVDWRARKPGLAIRRPRSEDADRLSEICILTGASGEDAREIEDEPDLLPAVFVEPYLRYEPSCAWVVEDRDGVCGYALGVADSRAFGVWMETNWWPELRARHLDPGPDRRRWTGSDWLRNWIHRPPDGLPQQLRNWPAHGHIDLLPRAQGTGIAKPLMLRLMQCLHENGATGLHLGVAAENRRALRFYEKLGFIAVEEASDKATTIVARGLPVGSDER